MKKISYILAAMLLTGCKINMETNISSSDIKDFKDVDTIIDVEVAGCSDHKDSRVQSKSLIKIMEEFPKVMPKSSFKECYSKEMKSYAQFLIQVPIKQDVDKSFVQNHYFVFNEQKQLLLAFPSELNDRIENFKQKNHLPKLDINFRVLYKNDTDIDQEVSFAAAYIDDAPQSFLTAYSSPSKSITKLDLSNVSIDQAKSDGAAFVLQYTESRPSNTNSNTKK